MQFTAQLGDEIDGLSAAKTEPYYISMKTHMTFRKCVMGEIFSSGGCLVCAKGSYSLETDVTDKTICKDCTNTEGVESCYGNTITVIEAYWRRYPPTSTVVSSFDVVVFL